MPERLGQIYVIRCRCTSKVYVGSTVNFFSRYNSHWNLLRAGKHHSKKLQLAWNKYGEENFEFCLVEEVATNRLRDAESTWISYYESYTLGYNSTTLTGQGTSIPLEVRERMSKGAVAAGKRKDLRQGRSERAKEQHRSKSLGQSTWSPGTLERVQAKNRRARPRVSRLTDDQVRELRQRAKNGTPLSRLAFDYGITKLWAKRVSKGEGRAYA